MEPDQNHVMPKQKHIGSRTLKDVKAGKVIRIDEDGFENFSDYWTDPDTSLSPASIHSRQSIRPDDNRNHAESPLAQEHESSVTLSPFTPSVDEFVNLETNSKSGIFTASCRQPSDVRSQIVCNDELKVVEKMTKDQSLIAGNIEKIKTITRNVHPVESDDIAVSVELPTIVAEHKSKTPVLKQGAGTISVEDDCTESATKGLKSSDVASTSSCERRVEVGQNPPAAEELMKDKSHPGVEKCLDLPTIGSKAMINPVVVLHALSPRCSIFPGTTSLTCASFPLNMKGDIAGTLSRPALGLPSAEIGQISPEVVRQTRKRLSYSTESPEVSNIVPGTQQSEIAPLEVNRIASSSVSSTDKGNETGVMSSQNLKMADIGRIVPQVTQSFKTISEELPVVTRERKSHCPATMKSKDIITSGYSSSCVNDVVVPVGRSLPIESAKDTSQSTAYSVEAQEVFSSDNEKQIPAEKDIEDNSLQDSETEANIEVVRNGDCFDLFDKMPSSLAPVLYLAREDDDLVAHGNGKNLISLTSRTGAEQDGNHSDADGVNDDDFQMVPLSQVKTIKLNYNVGDTKVGSKKVMKAAKPKARSNVAGAAYNCNLQSTVDASEHKLVEEQNKETDESPAILERPNRKKCLTFRTSIGRANKLSQVSEDGFTQKVCNNKTSSEPMRKQDEALHVDSAKNIVKNRRSTRTGYKRMKEGQPPDVLTKKRRRGTRSDDCCVSAQEDDVLSTEKVNRRVSRAVLSQPVRHTETEEEEEDMLDNINVSNDSRKLLIHLESEGSEDGERKGKKEDGKTRRHKTNIIKKVADTGQKRENLPSNEKNMTKSLTDASTKNKCTRSKRNFPPKIVPQRTKKLRNGKRNGKPTSSNPVSVTERVAGRDSLPIKDKTVLNDDQVPGSEKLMTTCGPTSVEASDGTTVHDLRKNCVLENSSTPECRRQSSRHAAVVAKQKRGMLLNEIKQKKINSVSRQSLLGKQTEGQLATHAEDQMSDAPNSSDLLTDDSSGKRKLRKRRMPQEEPLVVTIPNGVANKETPRINKPNVAKTPQLRLSVASRLHYFDGTISSKKAKNQKLHKIYPPEGSNAGGGRRSRRTRVKTLDWFRNERIHYERRESGFVVAGIYSPKIESDLEVAEKLVKRLNGKEKHPRKKKHAQQRNLSIHADLSCSLLSRTLSEIKVLNPQTQEEVFMECVKPVDQMKMVGVSGKPPSENEPLLLCKPIRQKTFASGTLIIRPLQIKKMQFVQNDTMLFHVIHGKVEVTIHQTKFVVESRDKFFVPVGNSYSIRNLRNEDSELDFTQIKS